MVVGHLAGFQEAAAMRCELVDEVIVVLAGLDALLHKQGELADCLIVAVVTVKPRERGVQLRLTGSKTSSSSVSVPTTALTVCPLSAFKPLYGIQQCLPTPPLSQNRIQLSPPSEPALTTGVPPDL